MQNSNCKVLPSNPNQETRAPTPIFNLCCELYAGELYVRFSKIVKQEFLGASTAGGLGPRKVLPAFSFSEASQEELPWFASLASRPHPSLGPRADLDVIERGAFAFLRKSHDANLISGAKCQSRNPAPSGGIAVGASRRQVAIGEPLIDLLIAHQDLELRDSVVLIEVLHVELVPSSGAVEPHCGRAAERRRPAFYCLASRSVLGRCDLDRHIALQLHGLGLSTIGVATDPALSLGQGWGTTRR